MTIALDLPSSAGLHSAAPVRFDDAAGVRQAQAAAAAPLVEGRQSRRLATAGAQSIRVGSPIVIRSDGLAVVLARVDPHHQVVARHQLASERVKD